MHREQVCQSPWIQCDDTTLDVQDPSRAPEIRTGHLWAYRGELGEVVYDFTWSRNRDGPLKMLAGYRGYQQVDAVGFSAGAQVLLRLAAAEPDRFKRLALLGVGSGVLAEGNPEHIVAALEGGADSGEPTGIVFRRLADRLGNDRAALIAFLRRPQRPLTAADLARISCPVLVVLGDMDPAGPGDDLVAMLPDARLVMLRGVDHFGTPADVRCMDAVLRFLGV